MHDERRSSVSEHDLAWVVHVAGATRASASARLPGSTTSSLHLIETEQAEGPRRLVLRRYDRSGVVGDPAASAAREAAAIEAARAYALGPTAPSLVAFAGDRAVPLVLMTHVSGSVVLPDAVPEADRRRWLHRLAAPIANAHATVPLPTGVPPWQPWLEEPLQVPAWSSEPGSWRRLIEVSRTAPPREPGDGVFLHGDWHPGNCLWDRGEVTGVVDWMWSAIGPAAADVAHCRTNLALLAEADLADAFLSAYRAHCPGHRHQAWFDAADLVSVVGDLDGVLALGAFGALAVEEVHRRADRWARRLASRIALAGVP